MKNYIIYLIGLITISGCNELDTKSFEIYDETTVWNTPQSAEAFVTNAYKGTLTEFSRKYAELEVYTPNGILNYGSFNEGFPLENIDRYYESGKSLESYFESLRSCNTIIEKVAQSSLSDLQKKQLIAEGHFLRGVLFFYQTLWQGRFVPILRVLDINDREAFKTPFTQNPAESYQYIFNDFDKAIEGLPETSVSGRVNKYAAYAFKSRAALQAYAYTKQESYIDLAIESANAVINSNKYSLADNYGNLFLEEGQYDKEIILAHYLLKTNTRAGQLREMFYAVPSVNNDDLEEMYKLANITDENQKELFKTQQPFVAWGRHFPTQDLVDQYLVIDQADGKAKVWHQTSQYLNNTEALDVNSLTEGAFNTVQHNVPEANDLGTNGKGSIIIRYHKLKNVVGQNISDLMYSNRDARFYHTIVYDQSQWLGENISTNILGNLWAGVKKQQSDSYYTTSSGYYWRKALRKVEPRVAYSTLTDFHFVLARLGEMYMNLAEAHLLKGDVAQAVNALNQTRTTHGKLPASTATTLQEAWQDYIRERRVEMAYEGDLYWSYLRWGQYGGFANEGLASGSVIQALNKPVHKIQITQNRDQIFVAQITRNDSWNRVFSTRRYLLPIPQGELDKREGSNIKDKQNPGW